MLHRLIINANTSLISRTIRSSYLSYNGDNIITVPFASRYFCSKGKDIKPTISQPKISCEEKSCIPGNKMDTLPLPDRPWDDGYEEANAKYTKHLLIGVLFATVSAAAVWFTTKLSKPDPVQEPQKLYTRPKPECRTPKEASALPRHVPYLLIGGGTASFSAFRAIKSADPTAKVLVISNECYLPYMRPPLSKEVWYNLSESNVKKLNFKQWNGTERSLFYEPSDFYIEPNLLNDSANGGVAVAQGYKVCRIDAVGKKIFLDDGTTISYDKCLIATGAKPKNLEVFASANDTIKSKVTLFRDIFDYQELTQIAKCAKSIAIVGGGFLGSELACALGKLSYENDFKVYQIFKEKGNMAKILPEYLSTWTTNKVRDEHVEIKCNTEIEDVSLTKDNKELILHLNNGEQINVTHVIVSVGVKPNTDLAKTSDLEIDPEHGGFLVNAEMEARSNLYVAGDCSCFYDVKLGRRRVEHHDHAVVTGRLAGENMVGAAKPYIHQSMFWSDLGPNIGYEAIGLVDSRLPTVAVYAKATEQDNPKTAQIISNTNLRSEASNIVEKRGKNKKMAIKEMSHENEGDDNLSPAKKIPNPTTDEYGKGVIFYLRNEIVVGIVLWNVFNRMSIARQVLKDGRKYEDLNEVAKLFNIHGD